MNRLYSFLVPVLTFTACVHAEVLEPAAGVPVEPGHVNVAEASVAGVAVEVSGDSWSGDPRQLGTLYTPVRVVIENHSGKPLRVDTGDFKLSGASGRKYSAVKPILTNGTIVVADRYSYVPRSSNLFPGLDDWTGTFDVGPERNAGYSQELREPLPTSDMLTEALPEGVVDDGAKVSGFIYFKSVAGLESTVQFEMKLADGHGGPALGHLAIPFRTTES